MMQGSSIMTETSTSMHMKALAMKYLKEEQISDAVQQKQKRDALSNLMVSNVQGTTNMSFATMRYLQRYQLLPESMNGLVEGKLFSISVFAFSFNLQDQIKPQYRIYIFSSILSLFFHFIFMEILYISLYFVFFLKLEYFSKNKNTIKYKCSSF